MLQQSMSVKLGYLVHAVGFVVNTIGFTYGTFFAKDHAGITSIVEYRGWPGKLKYLTYWCEVRFFYIMACVSYNCSVLLVT